METSRSSRPLIPEDAKRPRYGKSSPLAREFYGKPLGLGGGEAGEELGDLAAEPFGFGEQVGGAALDAGGDFAGRHRRTVDVAHAGIDLLRAAGRALGAARDLFGGGLLLFDGGGDAGGKTVDVLDLADDLL